MPIQSVDVGLVTPLQLTVTFVPWSALPGVTLSRGPVAAAWTTSVAAAEWTRLPLVPVTVKGYVPAASVEVVVMVRVELVVGADGLNDGVAPAGRPLADRATALAKPLL